MNPEAAIASLDRALAATGEDITLRRTTGSQQIPLDVTCRASVRGYQPQDLVGGIVQGDSKVILSPTEMKARQWCWPPRVNDKVLIQGKLRNVTAAVPIHVNGELVRVELSVRG